MDDVKIVRIRSASNGLYMTCPGGICNNSFIYCKEGTPLEFEVYGEKKNCYFKVKGHDLYLSYRDRTGAMKLYDSNEKAYWFLDNIRYKYTIWNTTHEQYVWLDGTEPYVSGKGDSKNENAHWYIDGMEGNSKKIFVSDIHMGDERSLNPSNHYKPYGWLGTDRAKKFAEFLKTCVLNDPDVEELVILGDLFDEWICPASCDPLGGTGDIQKQFEAIAAAPQNKGIIENLRLIAKCRKLIYVNGNHDIQLTEKIISAIIPGVKYMDAYQNNAESIRAEHGHSYTLLTAKDSYKGADGKPHILPSGYFITRLAAQYHAEHGEDPKPQWGKALLNVFEFWFEKHIGKKNIGSLVIAKSYEEFQKEVGYKDNIIMKGDDQFADSLLHDQIISLYKDIDSRWQRIWPDVWQAFCYDVESVMPDIKRLPEYGNFRCLAWDLAKKYEQRLIILGHTHMNEISIQPSCHSNEPLNVLYANTGSWIDSVKQCTFLETEQNGEKFLVGLKEYLGSGQPSKNLKQFSRESKNDPFKQQ